MRWQILLNPTGFFALMGRRVDRIAGSIGISLSDQISDVSPPSRMSQRMPSLSCTSALSHN
jgi:hypothetical protein